MAFADLLIYGLLLLAFVLFNLLPQWLRRRRQARPTVPSPETVTPPSSLGDIEWGRGPLPRPPEPRQIGKRGTWEFEQTASREVEAASAQALERVVRTSLEEATRPSRRIPRVHGARHLRDAIVLTAILGPCRAQEPHGSKEP
jgi:hypothetical protein